MANKNRFTRALASELATTAMQAGLTPESADDALRLGARFLVHGFTGGEIDRMIIGQYQAWARAEADTGRSGRSVSASRR